MLENVVATKVGQIKADGARVFRTGPNCLRPEEKCVRVFNIVTVQHARDKFPEVDVLAVARNVAMVCKSIEAGTGTASCVER